MLRSLLFVIRVWTATIEKPKMEQILTESDFWKQTLEEYNLSENIDAIINTQTISDGRIENVPLIECENGWTSVLLDKKIRLSVIRAVSEGENFMSQVFRLRANVNEKEYRCFVKVLPKNPALQEVTRKLELHQREILMYSDVFPYLRNLLLQADLNLSEYFTVPQLYHVNLGLNSQGFPTSKTILAIEDLSPAGFRTANKYQGCDLNHAKCVLRSLANFHALSNVMLRQLRNGEEKNENLEFFMKMGPECTPSGLMMFESALRTSKKLADHMGYPAIATKLESIINHAAQFCARETQDEAGVLACFVHGDSWTNNILFQYDTETNLPKAVTLVDWQVSSVGHPAKDIAYFFMTSTPKPLWRDHWNELLDTYFEHLRSLLHKLGFDLESVGYTKETFLSEFAARVPKALSFVSLVLPIILNESVSSQFKTSKASEDDVSNGNPEEPEESDQRMKRDYSKNVTVEALVSNRSYCNRYLDLVLELLGRGWF